ncbi:MAG: ferredoxin--NADP reductase [Microscillaceae bacterium]|nr:ferredoxin--NADP reductase [Microscillaceae bacterium]MDW8461182.1 ferredoxin--NADP reductase [Cytophagales bacterium]
MQKLQLKVKSIIPQTDQAIQVIFEQPEQERLAYKAGQFLTFLLNIEGEEFRRAYSLCSSPFANEPPSVAIKRVAEGKVSNFLNDTLKEGYTLTSLPPKGVFTTDLSAHQKRHFVFFAGGSGITPIFSLLKSVLLVEKESKVSLIYANRNIHSIIFKQDLEQWQQQYANRFQMIHILEQAPSLSWQYPTGYLTPEMIKELLAQLPQMNIRDTEYFMCGPAPMMQIIEQSFVQLGIPKEKLRKENFALSPEESAQGIESQTNILTTTSDFLVTIHYEGLTHQVIVKPTQTILEAALKQGIQLPYSCQSGLCTACMGKCIQGKVKLDEEDALTPKELEQGYILTCVGHPLTPNVVIEID